MAVKQVKKARQRYWIWIAAILVTGYFGYHAFNGGHGIIAMRGLKVERAELIATLARLEARKADLEHRVSLLRPESIDPDMLDERARALLNQAHPNEIVLTIKTPAATANLER